MLVEVETVSKAVNAEQTIHGTKGGVEFVIIRKGTGAPMVIGDLGGKELPPRTKLTSFRKRLIKLTDYQAELLEELTLRLPDRLDESVAGSAGEVAERMVAIIPGSSIWQEKIGPFYGASSIAKWKGVSRQHIYTLRSQGMLLGVQTGDEKTLLFPAWQFGLKGESLPHLKEVVEVLRPTARDDWSQALWLNAKTPRFEGKSAADLMKADDVERVLDAALNDARRLAS